MMKILVFDTSYHLSNKFMADMLKIKDICLPDYLSARLLVQQHVINIAQC